MENIEFYKACAQLLNTEYNCQPFTSYKRTRWNNRSAGSGRYEGSGIIRIFGNVVQVNLYNPVIINGVFDKHIFLGKLSEAISEK